MASRKAGLGRGLDFLFGENGFNPGEVSIEEPAKLETPSVPRFSEEEIKPENTTETSAVKAETEAAEGVVYINIADIKPNSKQPRKTFNEDALQELADSIREYGVIQPILVRPALKGYELVAGERRWRAARKAELKKIPAIIREIDDKQNAYFALIENMQREDLNALEEAEGISVLMNEYELTQEEAAKAVGKSRPYVTNALRLLKLPESIRELVINGKLSAGAARAIAGLKTEELQLEAAEKAVKEGWSVRQIENYTGSVKPVSKKKKNSAKSKKKDQAVLDVEESLSQKLGTRVELNGTEKAGKIEISYYSREELDRILEMLG